MRTASSFLQVRPCSETRTCLGAFPSTSGRSITLSDRRLTSIEFSPSFARFYTTSDQEFEVITVDKAKQNVKVFDVIIDVREPDEVAAGRIEGSKHVTLGRVFRDVKTPEIQDLKGKKILLYCRSGARSGMACKVLKNAGFDVTNLEGGWNAWSTTK